ncbi:MAG TPA: LamG domain-containing protein, partial [Pontibacter sp.]
MLYSYHDASLSNSHTSVNYNTTLTSGVRSRLYNHAIAVTVILFAIFLSVPALAQCPPGLIHYFPLDETEAGTYKDNVSPVTATCTNCPSPVNSLFAGAQKFDGRDDGLVINETEGFQWGLYDSFTIEFWVKVEGTSSQNRVIMGRNSSDMKMSWWVGVDKEGYIVFDLYDMGQRGFRLEKQGKKINDGKWHHIVVMGHGTHLRNRLYIDGYRVANYRYEYANNFYSTLPVTIGRHNLDHGYHFSGLLDEVMVYNR